MFRFLLTILLLAAAMPLPADIVSFPISSDFDAEFAQAADLLEAGERARALEILEQIGKRSGQPAWTARIDMLLAADEQRRGAWESAAKHLASAPAASIGLEPYRRMSLGRVLAAVGKSAQAEEELKAAFESDEPFAMRAQAGQRLAELLEKEGRSGKALEVLSRASASAPPEEIGSFGAERFGLALRLHDAGARRAAARDLIAAGVQPEGPAAFRRAFAEELARVTPAERARFARARIAAGDARRGVRLLKLDIPSRWPASERAANLFALARGLRLLGDGRAADKVAAGVPEDGTEASFEAKLLRAEIALEQLHAKRPTQPSPDDPVLLAVRRSLLDLASPASPLSVRITARGKLVSIAGERERFEEGLEEAQRLLAEGSPPAAGFEPLWKLAWRKYLAGDCAAARASFSALRRIYEGVPERRRLSYWIARCLQREGRLPEAIPIYRELASSQPADLYGLLSRSRAGKYTAQKPAEIADPSTATATYRRTDELLRLRWFTEAAAEARELPRSRGRDRRLAQADFALGRFPAAVAAAKRAFPEMGTAAEGRVPDPWRRLFYPIEIGGFLSERASEFHLDPAVLRALVRQESVFEAGARSKAGALGLTQLMPTTARSLSRSVLRQRYRKAFLYDPKINARLGAAYFHRLLDRFGGDVIYALAAYNGGPTRMARVLRENSSRQEDEVFESHPASETREYVRRVLLFAESYRELYPSGLLR